MWYITYDILQNLFNINICNNKFNICIFFNIIDLLEILFDCEADGYSNIQILFNWWNWKQSTSPAIKMWMQNIS